MIVPEFSKSYLFKMSHKRSLSKDLLLLIQVRSNTLKVLRELSFTVFIISLVLSAKMESSCNWKIKQLKRFRNLIFAKQKYAEIFLQFGCCFKIPTLTVVLIPRFLFFKNEVLYFKLFFKTSDWSAWFFFIHTS